MKINNSSNSLPLTSANAKKARAGATQSKDSATTASVGDTSVNLGTAATQLLSMGGSEASTPPSNTAKVAQIKQAISEGRFQVNSGAVADSLIKSVNELISAQRR